VTSSTHYKMVIFYDTLNYILTSTERMTVLWPFDPG